MFGCRKEVILIHNNCVTFFPTRRPVTQAWPSTHLCRFTNPEWNVFQSSLPCFVEEGRLVLKHPERATCLFRVHFPVFEVQMKTDRCKPNRCLCNFSHFTKSFKPSLSAICSYFRYDLNLGRNQKSLRDHREFKNLIAARRDSKTIIWPSKGCLTEDSSSHRF